jgi:hypothetical protein
VSAFVSSVPIEQPSLSLRDMRLYGFVAAFSVGNLALPMAVHTLPQGGLIFLPIFFFTLVAAYRFGLTAGVLTALASPLLNHFLTGMPPTDVLAGVVARSLLVAVFAAMLASRTGRLSVWSLLLAAVAMQLGGFAFDLVLGGSVASGLEILRLGIPGVAIMAVGGYFALRLLARSGIGAGRAHEPTDAR